MKLTTIMTLIMTILLVGCSAQQDSVTGAAPVKDTINIGATLFLSNNDYVSVATAMQEGMDIATEEINAHGGLLGKQVRIIYEDDQLSIAKAITATHKLIEIDEINAGLMGIVNTAKAAGPIFEEANVPLVVLWDANEDLEKIGEYVFGTGFQTEAAGYSMAEFLHSKDINTIAVIRHVDEWSQLISDSLVKRFKELGGTVLLDESLEIGETDFRTVLVKAKSAEAIYSPLVGQFDIFLKQAKEQGYGGLVASGDAVNEEIIANAGEFAEGVYFTQIFIPQNEHSKNLQKAYVQKYGKEQEFRVFNALGYDGVMTVAEAIKIAQSDDPVAIHKALYEIQDFEGASGQISINEKGSAVRFERLFVVKDGEMVLIE